ncbi:MAG: 50S ribosomal protein L24 [Candidatus Falkowbacteria bacterium]
MKIKKGDKVKILTGKDNGKTGKVLQVFPARNRVSVEGLNLSIKHMRPRRQNEKGQRIEFPAPLNASNLMLVCPKCNKPSRVGFKVVETKKPEGQETKPNKKKFRVCQKCKQIIN